MVCEPPNHRERSWPLMQPGIVPVADMAALAGAHPNGRFVFHYGVGDDGDREIACKVAGYFERYAPAPPHLQEKGEAR